MNLYLSAERLCVFLLRLLCGSLAFRLPRRSSSWRTSMQCLESSARSERGTLAAIARLCTVAHILPAALTLKSHGLWVRNPSGASRTHPHLSFLLPAALASVPFGFFEFEFESLYEFPLRVSAKNDEQGNPRDFS
jgi:hypothetical protein